MWLLIIVLNCGEAKTAVLIAGNSVQMVADVGSNTLVLHVIFSV